MQQHITHQIRKKAMDGQAKQLADLLDRYQPDEVIVNAQIWDHATRLKSVEIGAKVLRELGAEAA